MRFSFLFGGLILVFLLILPEFMGVAGVWLAVPIAELLTMVVALIFLYQNKGRYFGMPDCQSAWETRQHDLPELKTGIARILKKDDE